MIVYNILSAKINIKNEIIWKENSSPKCEFTLHLWEKKKEKLNQQGFFMGIIWIRFSLWNIIFNC